MRDARELKQPSEDAPLFDDKLGKKAALPEDEVLGEVGFAVRDLSASSIRWWLILQLISILFTVSLWWEVSGHLARYDELVRQECSNKGRSVHGICAGPMWNVSLWQELDLPSTHHYASRSLEFQTHSNPPTFLVEVTPVSLSGHVEVEVEDSSIASTRFTLDLTRVDPPQANAHYSRILSGQHAVTLEDLSQEAQHTMQTKGRLVWRASISARMRSGISPRFVFFVEDAGMSHLSDIHNGACEFGKAWRSFNEAHQGHNHRMLTRCQSLLSIFIVIGGAAVYVVYTECTEETRRVGGRRFHMIVLGKFMLQDFPQQACIVLYILGWYEASGLKCQMCLFDPQHCSDEHPFHFSNAVACLCVLLSSISNQLLVKPVLKKEYPEDDVWLRGFLRLGGLCLATLPFSTGICYASPSVLPMSVASHVLFALPCAIGWLAFSVCVCIPATTCCDIVL
mmetsp:Transcript_22306/g.51053  ORF Transcript_22306/g.51053 Transcript_22306/m.51053 type:complete len:453 (+) Transcript_22306:137-1495(+)